MTGCQVDSPRKRPRDCSSGTIDNLASYAAGQNLARHNTLC